MKKIIGVLMVLSLVLLVGCGGSSDANEKTTKTTTASSNFAKVEVKSGEYAIIPDVSEDDLSTLALTIKVTNTGKEKLLVDSYGFELYEKDSDEKVKAEDVFDRDIDTFESDNISKDKNITGTIFFNIDPKKEYKLVFEAMDDSGESEDVELDLDVTKYEDSKKALDESLKAASAFIDVQFLAKDNEDYAKLVGNDEEKTKTELLDKFQKENEDDLFYDIDLSDEDYQKCFDSFTSVQGKRAKMDKELVAQYGDEAVVSIEINEGLSTESIYDLFFEYEEKYMESTDDYEGYEEYAFSKYTEILEKSELKSDSHERLLYLEKKDGKWNVDIEKTENEDLIMALQGSIY